MEAAHRPAPTGGTGRLGPPREWLLWREPRPAVLYIVGVSALTLGLGIAYALQTSWRPYELLTFGVLVVCALACVEGTRRQGEPAGLAKDLLFTWGLPVVVFLPPVYAFLFPVLPSLLTQIRVTSSLYYRRAFSTAAKALGAGVASLVFHRTLAGGDPAGAGTGLVDVSLSIPLAAASGALCIVLNQLVVACAVHLSSLQLSWRAVLWDREAAVLDLVELCVGVLVTLAAVFALPLVFFALPPVLLLQRSLVHAHLRAAARMDPKTGLLNAAAWQREAEREVARATRTRSFSSLLLIDIDHFKQVNDDHGHLLGDHVLVEISALLGGQLRDYDLLGRFGGEEFVVLLPDTDTDEACRVAERLRASARRATFSSDKDKVSVTVSIGVAALRTHAQDLTELLAAADLALYHAKATGRDRVCLPAGDATGWGAVDAGRISVGQPPTRQRKEADRTWLGAKTAEGASEKFHPDMARTLNGPAPAARDAAGADEARPGRGVRESKADSARARAAEAGDATSSARGLDI